LMRFRLLKRYEAERQVESAKIYTVM